MLFLNCFVHATRYLWPVCNFELKLRETQEAIEAALKAKKSQSINHRFYNEEAGSAAGPIWVGRSPAVGAGRQNGQPSKTAANARFTIPMLGSHARWQGLVPSCCLDKSAKLCHTSFAQQLTVTRMQIFNTDWQVLFCSPWLLPKRRRWDLQTMLNPRCYYFGLQVDPIEALSEAIPGSPGSPLAMMFLQPSIPFLISSMHCNVDGKPL